jgi:hypothetical protein
MFCRTHYNDTALFRCGSFRICSADLRIRIAGIPSAFPFLIIACSMLLVHSQVKLELDELRAKWYYLTDSHACLIVRAIVIIVCSERGLWLYGNVWVVKPRTVKHVQ